MVTQEILNKDSKHELVKAFQFLDETDEVFHNISKYRAKEFDDALIQMMDEAASDESCERHSTSWAANSRRSSGIRRALSGKLFGSKLVRRRNVTTSLRSHHNLNVANH